MHVQQRYRLVCVTCRVSTQMTHTASMKHRARPQPSPLSAGYPPSGAMADLFEHFQRLVEAGYDCG